MEEEEKDYVIEINGEEFKIQDEVGNLILNISLERDGLNEFQKAIVDAKKKFGNDADLGKFVRSYINDYFQNSEMN